MGLFVEGHHLPDGGVAIPIPEGVQGHLHAVVPEQRIVVQELEDLHHHLDRHAGADRRALPRAGAQPQKPIRLEAALPVIDHMGINRQQGGHAAGAKADLEQFNNPPAGLLFGRVFTIGPKADQQVLGPQGLLQALRVGGRLEGQTELVPRRPGRRGRLSGPLAMALQASGER